MARAGQRAAAVGAALLLLASCQPGQVAYRIKEFGLQFRISKEVRDLTYVIGEGGEGQPAAMFSSRSLTKLGGARCAAGAEASVSSFPLGMLVISEEKPAKVRAEQAKNPDEGLGEYVKQVGDRYLYYSAPPPEHCARNNPAANKLQDRQVAILHKALPTAWRTTAVPSRR